MFQEKLKQYVLDNPKSVSMRPSVAYPGLFILKYRKSVFYNNTWDEYLENCRGTIVDKDFNVVSRPFTKVYNFGIEEKAPKLDDSTLVTAYRKVNGFLVAVTWYNGDVLVSTTGSTESPYVDMAKQTMVKQMSWPDWEIAVCSAKGTTLMFECVHKDDPHIVPEDEGMYFLGYRENTWDSQVKGFGVDISNHWDELAKGLLKCKSVESYVLPLGELHAKVKTVDHEGFMCYTKDNQSFKIKSPHYLTSKWMARNPRTDKLMSEDFKKQIDEEYYPLLSHIRENIESYTALDEQARLAWIRNYMETV